MIWIVFVLVALGMGWLVGHGDHAANARHAAEAAPASLVGALLGVTLGLYGRDRVRLRRTYSSPTLAYSGKALFVAASTVAATFAMTPVAWPASSLFLGAALGAAGLALWIGNLPPKL